MAQGKRTGRPSGLSKLTDEQRKFIRSYFTSGNATLTKKEVGALYGVTREQVVYIVYGKTK